MKTPSDSVETNTREKQGNPFLSLALNIVIPAAILMKLSGEDRLGPVYGLLVALAFPLAYGLYDFVQRKNFNLLSVVGFTGILLTGGVGLLRLNVQWIAFKEAGVPLLIGLAILASLKTPFPFVKKLLDKVIDMKRVYEALQEKGTVAVFERRLVYATYLLGASFFLSAALNYALAKAIVVSPSGTSAFNEELGKMTALSFPVIAIPMVIIIGLDIQYLFSGIKKLTDLDLKSIFR